MKYKNMIPRTNVLDHAKECGFEVIREYGEDECCAVKMLRSGTGQTALFLVIKNREQHGWMDMYGLMCADDAQERFRDCIMEKDLCNARTYSGKRSCTVWAASNGRDIIWSDSRSQVEREGFWICQIFEDGHIVEA